MLLWLVILCHYPSTRYRCFRTPNVRTAYVQLCLYSRIAYIAYHVAAISTWWVRSFAKPSRDTHSAVWIAPANPTQLCNSSTRRRINLIIKLTHHRMGEILIREPNRQANCRALDCCRPCRLGDSLRGGSIGCTATSSLGAGYPL